MSCSRAKRSVAKLARSISISQDEEAYGAQQEGQPVDSRIIQGDVSFAGSVGFFLDVIVVQISDCKPGSLEERERRHFTAGIVQIAPILVLRTVEGSQSGGSSELASCELANLRFAGAQSHADRGRVLRRAEQVVGAPRESVLEQPDFDLPRLSRRRFAAQPFSLFLLRNLSHLPRPLPPSRYQTSANPP